MGNQKFVVKSLLWLIAKHQHPIIINLYLCAWWFIVFSHEIYFCGSFFLNASVASFIHMSQSLSQKDSMLITNSYSPLIHNEDSATITTLLRCLKNLFKFQLKVLYVCLLLFELVSNVEGNNHILTHRRMVSLSCTFETINLIEINWKTFIFFHNAK